jgi:hypothetical protein
LAEKSLLWTTGATGDGATAYTQAQIIRWQRQFFLNDANEGVLYYLNNLEVTGTSSPVAVDTGAACVYGFPYWNTTSVDVAIPTPSGNTRIDRVVLRANWSAQTVRITRIAGTEGSGTPPALVQADGTTWDIPLAQCSITTGGTITVTMGREYMHPNIRVETIMLDDDAVTVAKMADNSVDSDQYVNASIDRVHLEADIIDGTKIEDAAVDTEHLAADSVDGTKIADDVVDSEHYVHLSIDSNILAPDCVIAGKIASGGVSTTAELANDIVDDTKAGNRVPQFYRRQGGHATNWNVVGNTTYTPTAVRMQGGVKQWTGGAAQIGSVVVTFPVAFSATPLMFINCTGAMILGIVITYSSTTTNATIYWAASQTETTIDFAWLAIGPE